ncbi:MAG TPA: hypothetical protein VFR78_00985 [Pyrinomonadaceae bacterium]|nr:hypothetical protein [Pyrinomonadaceae bacterium]
MKPHKSIGAYSTVISFLLIAGCSANNSTTMASFQKASAEEKTARTFNCQNANAYSFVVVLNPSRQKETDPAVPEDLHIVVGDEVISTVELPKESQVKNFGLSSVKKTKAGFEINIDWGGGNNYYEVQFNFRCRKNNFYLYRVRNVSLSTTNPDSGNFLDKKVTRVKRITPNLPIEKFVMLDYL